MTSLRRGRVTNQKGFRLGHWCYSANTLERDISECSQIIRELFLLTRNGRVCLARTFRVPSAMMLKLESFAWIIETQESLLDSIVRLEVSFQAVIDTDVYPCSCRA